MKRRDAIRLIPLSIAGLSSLPLNSFSSEKLFHRFESGQEEPLAISYTKKIRERLKWIRDTELHPKKCY